MASYNAESLESNHAPTAAALKGRGLEVKLSVPLKAPRTLSKIRNDFIDLLRTKCHGPPQSSTRCSLMNQPLLPFAKNDLTKLETILTTDYKLATKFDESLFGALRGCVGEYKMQQDEENFIILKNIGHDSKYAVGFARQVRTALDLLPKLEATSQTDHKVCLFENVSGNDWRVKECFGVIELNMRDTSCQEFRVVNNSVPSVDLESSHGALGQAILYTIESVVLYQARNGISEASIPLAVIAGRRLNYVPPTATQSNNKRQKPLERLRWVSGRLHKPETCCGRYTFSVDGFGRFYDQNNKYDKLPRVEKESAAQTMRLYLDTLLFGLNIAIRVRDCRNDGTIPLPVPASGQVVKIGTKHLSSMLQFCASPIPGAQPFSKIWNIRQGDLFEGSINVGEILDQPNLDSVNFLNETNHMETNVLVKISSKAVHRLLIDPVKAMGAIERVRNGEPAMVQEIGTVLLAVIRPDIGLVTIMSDLSGSFDRLSPKDNADHLPALWSGFSDLVQNVLLPMAAKTVVHPDIRPGYDVTLNVLCRLTDDGDQKKVTLKLIDFESLTQVQDWEVPMDGDKDDDRYLPRLGRQDAITYVWWQCIFIAYVWKEKIHANDVGKPRGSKGTVVEHLTGVLLHNMDVLGSSTWLLDFRQRAQEKKGEIDAACVKDTLVDLAKLFR